MQFLFLFLVAGLIGYLLSAGDKGDELQERTNEWVNASESRLERLSKRVFPPPVEMQLKTWALGDGAGYFSSDFRDWLANLPGAQSHDFANSLWAYLEGLGYHPEALLRGDLEATPEREKEHARAILVYSKVYRTAKQVQKSDVSPMGESEVRA